MKLKPDTIVDMEIRNFQVDEIRLDETADKKPVIRGHAAVFNKLSENLGGFREQIAPGAFKHALSGDVRALINHDPNFVLGRTKSGTLTLREDSKGLAIEIDPPETQAARDLLISIKRGDISQMSFGFRTVSDEWRYEGKDTDNGRVAIRTLKEVELFDVSPVTFAAYPQTDVAVRSLKAWEKSQQPEVPDYDLMKKKLDLAGVS